MSDAGGAVFAVLLWAVGCVSTYLVVRAAVRAGIEDAWKRRAQRENAQQSAPLSDVGRGADPAGDPAATIGR